VERQILLGLLALRIVKSATPDFRALGCGAYKGRPLEAEAIHKAMGDKPPV
jgi:hypothetical protein